MEHPPWLDEALGHLDLGHVLGSTATMQSARVRDEMGGIAIVEVVLKRRPQEPGKRASYRRVNLLFAQERSGAFVFAGERLFPRLDLYLEASGHR